MTAGPSEDTRARQTQAAGEAAAAAHQRAAEAQHQASGSTSVVEQASTPDDVAVNWSNADTTAQPTLRPSPARPVGEYEVHGPPAA